MERVHGAAGKTRFYVPFILAFLVFSAVLLIEYVFVSELIEDSYQRRASEYHSLSNRIIPIMDLVPDFTTDSGLDELLQTQLPSGHRRTIQLQGGIVPDNAGIRVYSVDNMDQLHTGDPESWNNLIIEEYEVKMSDGRTLQYCLIEESDGQINNLHDTRKGIIIILIIMVIVTLVPGGLMIESFWRRRRMTGPEIGRGQTAIHESVLGILGCSSQVGIMVVDSSGEIIWVNSFCRTLLEMSQSEPVSSIASVMSLPAGLRQGWKMGRSEIELQNGTVQLVLKSMTGKSRYALMEELAGTETGIPGIRVLVFIPSRNEGISTGVTAGSDSDGSGDVLLRSDAEMLGSIMHQMRNHLSGIVGMASVELEQGTEGTSEESISAIMDSAGKLTTLCEDIESILRNEGSSSLRDPLEEISFISDVLKRILPRGVDFQVSGRSRHMISTPRELVREFLYNLAVNSADTMNGEGRIRIDVSDRIPDELTGIASLSPDSMVAVRYSDGFIMPVALRDVLSSRKYTDSDVERQFGTTIGTLYRVVREMNGRIVFERGSGETVLCLLLQGIDRIGGTSPEPESVTRELAEMTGLRVLVADSERSVLRSTCEFLEHNGMEVTPVTESSRALELLRKGGFDAAVLDMSMPGTPVDGIVRYCQTSLPDMAVIISTGYGVTGPERDLLEFPSIASISKPHRPEILVETIYSILGRIRMEENE